MSKQLVLSAGLFELTRAAARSAWEFAAIEKKLSEQAAATVTEEAKQEASLQGGTAGKASREGLIRQEGRAVRYGGEPWAMGAEFGSIQYRQFQPWRGSAQDAGYFLYPSARLVAEELIKHWEDEIDTNILR